MRRPVAVVASAALLALVAGPARAEEMFLCADKTLIRIDSARRAMQYEHPCVVDWFKAAKVTPAAAGTPGPSAPAVTASARQSDEPIKRTRAGRRR